MYSMLSVFGISMPLVYGEGRWGAFNRLRRELVPSTTMTLYFPAKSRGSATDDSLSWSMLVSSINKYSSLT